MPSRRRPPAPLADPEIRETLAYLRVAAARGAQRRSQHRHRQQHRRHQPPVRGAST
jgi:hypothetical protein